MSKKMLTIIFIFLFANNCIQLKANVGFGDDSQKILEDFYRTGIKPEISLSFDNKKPTIIKKTIKWEDKIFYFVNNKLCAFKNDEKSKKISNKFTQVEGIETIYFNDKWIDEVKIFTNKDAYVCVFPDQSVFFFKIDYIRYFVYKDIDDIDEKSLGNLLPYCYLLNEKKYFYQILDRFKLDHIPVAILENKSIVKEQLNKNTIEVISAIGAYCVRDGFGASKKYLSFEKKSYGEFIITTDIALKYTDNYEGFNDKINGELKKQVFAVSDLTSIGSDYVKEIIFLKEPTIQFGFSNGESFFLVPNSFLEKTFKFIKCVNGKEFLKRNSFFEDLLIRGPEGHDDIYNFPHVKEIFIPNNNIEGFSKCTVFLSFCNSDAVVQMVKINGVWYVENYIYKVIKNRIIEKM